MTDFEAPKLVREITTPLTRDERDSLLLDMHERIVRMEVRAEALPDHENRIRGLERWKYGIPGTLLLALLSLFNGSTPFHW